VARGGEYQLTFDTITDGHVDSPGARFLFKPEWFPRFSGTLSSMVHPRHSRPGARTVNSFGPRAPGFARRSREPRSRRVARPRGSIAAWRMQTIGVAMSDSGSAQPVCVNIFNITPENLPPHSNEFRPTCDCVSRRASHRPPSRHGIRKDISNGLALGQMGAAGTCSACRRGLADECWQRRADKLRL